MYALLMLALMHTPGAFAATPMLYTTPQDGVEPTRYDSRERVEHYGTPVSTDAIEDRTWLHQSRRDAPVTRAQVMYAPSPTRGMVYLPGGTFTMGSVDGYPDEAPLHRVDVAPFWMDATEVTNAQFRAFIRATGYVTTAERLGGGYEYTSDTWGWKWRPGCDWRHPHGTGSSINSLDDHPVVQVSWFDAKAYADWAGLALPTEAQWEYAARYGSPEDQYFPWGNELSPGGRAMANTWQGVAHTINSMQDGYRYTSPVGSYPPTRAGLYDMIGNVWEWCADWYDSTYYDRAAKRDVSGPSEAMTNKCVRGGSWWCSPDACHAYYPTYRGRSGPGETYSHTGFRCVRNVGGAWRQPAPRGRTMSGGSWPGWRRDADGRVETREPDRSTNASAWAQVAPSAPPMSGGDWRGWPRDADGRGDMREPDPSPDAREWAPRDPDAPTMSGGDWSGARHNAEGPLDLRKPSPYDEPAWAHRLPPSEYNESAERYRGPSDDDESDEPSMMDESSSMPEAPSMPSQPARPMPTPPPAPHNYPFWGHPPNPDWPTPPGPAPEMDMRDDDATPPMHPHQWSRPSYEGTPDMGAWDDDDVPPQPTAPPVSPQKEMRREREMRNWPSWSPRAPSYGIAPPQSPWARPELRESPRPTPPERDESVLHHWPQMAPEGTHSTRGRTFDDVR